MKYIKYHHFLFILVVVGFLLRIYNINSDLLFHTDQGLHSTAIWNIWHEKNISLLGHPSDVDGLNHSPVYYWLMIPSYFISGGNPAVASTFQILLEAISIPFLYLAIKRIFDKNTALTTIIIYTFSYGLISYSRWLVNVTPILAFSNLLIYFISLQPNRNKINNSHLFITSLLVGFITQFNAAIGIFLIPFLFWFYLKGISIKRVFLIITAILLPALPLIIFQFRHDFVTLKAILTFISSTNQGLGFPFKMTINNLQILLKQTNSLIIYPFIWISSILFVFSLAKLKEIKHYKIVIAYLFIPFIFLSFFQRGAISFFFTSMYSIILAILSFGLTKLRKRLFIISLVAILVINIYHLERIYRPTNADIPIGNANLITIQDRKNIIDWAYQKAEGKKFSIWFYTIPYFQEDVWNYILNWYALPKYGYLPEKTGGFTPNDLNNSVLFFNIYEPDLNQKNRQNSWLTDVRNNFGEINATFRSNDLIIHLHNIEGDNL